MNGGKLLSCPLCDSENLGVSKTASEKYAYFRCREASCHFAFSAARTILEVAGVDVPPPVIRNEYRPVAYPGSQPLRRVRIYTGEST